jgi:putative membrane-bound dehydrogenase-like protein
LQNSIDCFRFKNLWGLTLTFALTGFGSPKTDAADLGSFVLAEGLAIELVAAEPLVFDPVALAFDEAGRMFVVENRGYPTGPGEGKPPAGSVALLEDTDEDGVYDKRNSFAEGLNFPNGVLPSKGGVYITDAPDLLFLRDTDGDGRADTREAVLTGFSEGGSTQLRVSHPTFGPDGWIYMTNGLSGGTVSNPNRPDLAPIENRGGDWRFDPRTGEVEIAAGQAQFGLTFDDFGRRFICMNRKPIEHIVLEPRYLARNSRFAWTEMVQTISGGQETPAPLFPISANITTADSHAGTFTAACGLTVYRGNALPKEFDGCCFVCDPTGNLVHCDRLIEDGATFRADSATPGKEFLASTDIWFRPVYLANGPDGAFYVCDMRRKNIEHPIYLPEEIAAVTDFDTGKDQGRIYRVVAEEAKTEKPPRLDTAWGDSPIKTLDRGIGWDRDTARRLLLEGESKEWIEPLRAFSDKAKNPEGRFQALSTLASCDELDISTLLPRLSDSNAGVREGALVGSEPFLAESPSLVEEVLRLADDPDPRVRFHCALALGEVGEGRALEALGRIARRDGGDRWTVAAILTSIAGRESDFFRLLLQSEHWERELNAEMIRDLAKLVVASSASEAAVDCFRRVLNSRVAERFPAQVGATLGFCEGFRKSRGSNLEPILSSNPHLGEPLQAIVRRCAQIALDDAVLVDERERATRLLGFHESESGAETLEKLVNPYEPKELQIAAVEALVELPESDLAALLFEREKWDPLTPAVRDAALAAAARSARHLPVLLAVLEEGTLRTNEVNPTIKNRLLNHADAKVKERAQALFGSIRDEDRKKVYEEFKTVLDLPSDSKNGREVFKKNCAQCHRLDGEGYEVGPDLFTVRNKPKETLLLQILIPNQEMVPGFTNYLIETKGGEILTGIVAAESPTSLTLKWSGGEEVTLLRENILEMRSTQLSLMPQNLENNVTKQEMADLLAYLKGEGVRKGE